MAAPPPILKGVVSFLKLAKEYDKRDRTIAYFCRMYAVQKGIKIDSKSPESKAFLFGLMDQLESEKKLTEGEFCCFIIDILYQITELSSQTTVFLETFAGTGHNEVSQLILLSCGFPC